jgi:hypothetical protein
MIEIHVIRPVIRKLENRIWWDAESPLRTILAHLQADVTA